MNAETVSHRFSMSKSTLAIFLLIILEGYVVLSSELLAIRLSIPFVGSGTDTVSVIIAAVLMPLAFGYYAGGHFKPGTYFDLFSGSHRYITVREKLIRNMIFALLFLLLAISYSFLHWLLISAFSMGFTHRVLVTAFYSALFIAPPVYLLGQTIPLACNFFSKDKLSKITGRILFFSTLGSFLGAVFSTIVLMATIGVNYTAALNFIILAILITMLSKPEAYMRTILVWTLALAGVVFNSNTALKTHAIIENNQYNTIAVRQYRDQRHLVINNNGSSMYSKDGRKYPYIEFIERIAINPIAAENLEPKDVLVLGAGAFTLGADDEYNHYDFVDIDENLKDIAEKHILKRPIGENKTFHPMPARAFLNETEKQYDLIVLDAYSGAITIPEHMITVEFFRTVKAKLKPDGKVIANMAVSPSFLTSISQRVDNTMRAVFPHMSRHVIHEEYTLWDDDEANLGNVMYIYRHQDDEDRSTIYTDVKNSSFIDRPRHRP
ncbi:MAG: fused MFS/spermidine synthase [Alphaproteobacteria bacterium]|nr:fused MFS/spermidine synthase [Alphaproteobacteria bacterium]